MAKQDSYSRYTIRIPSELYDQLKQAAGEKSVNAEIIHRLEQSFSTPQKTNTKEIIVHTLNELVIDNPELLELLVNMAKLRESHPESNIRIKHIPDTPPDEDEK